jgi:hypothetical protein
MAIKIPESTISLRLSHPFNIPASAYNLFLRRVFIPVRDWLNKAIPIDPIGGLCNVSVIKITGTLLKPYLKLT